MFVRTKNAGRAIRLDSIIELEITGSSPSVKLMAVLASGGVDEIATYSTAALAQEAFDYLIGILGQIVPPGAVT